MTVDPDRFVDGLEPTRAQTAGAGVTAAANHSSDEAGPRPFKLR